MNYYRKFVQGYAWMSRPLNKLILGDNANTKKKLIEWSEDAQEAFLNLKNACTKTPVLTYANYTKPFKIHTDVSELGLGAVLYQEQGEGTDHPIAFASRSLSKSEKGYDVHKLEFLALKWAINDRFHEYVYGGQFWVYTGNNPLTYILCLAKLDATGQRWVASLARYNFDIKYRSGKSNIKANALSRIPWINEEPDVQKVQIKTLLICKSLGTTNYPEYLPWKNTSTVIQDGVL